MPLLSARDLATRLHEPNLRVVDTRWYLLRPGDGRAAYETGHIPGAIHLDLDADLSAAEGPGRHPLPEPADFTARMATAGIGTDSVVVAYDDAGGTVAARLWWMLDNLGHEHVYVLDGGLAAWTEAGNELTTAVPRWQAASLMLGGRWTNVIDRDALESRLDDFAVLDGRAPERYRGDVEPIDPKAGHIPTAISAPTAGNLDANGHFLPADDLRVRFEALPTDDKPVVSSCGSGTTACHNILAMRLAGLPDPLLYPGSFSDWSTAGMPVAIGDAPGTLVEAAL